MTRLALLLVALSAYLTAVLTVPTKSGPWTDADRLLFGVLLLAFFVPVYAVLFSLRPKTEGEE